MKKISAYYKYILVTIICIFLILLFGAAAAKVGDSCENLSVWKIEDEWTFTRNEDEPEVVNLNEYSFKNAQKGEQITLVRTLPEDRLVQPALAIKIYHCAVKAEINGMIIYEYGSDLYENDKSLGNGYHIISLPKDYEGNKIKITLQIGENDAFPNIEPLLFMEESDFAPYILRNNILEIVVGIFLMSLGIVLFCSLLIQGKLNKEFRKVLWLSIVAFTAGSWTLAQCDFLGLICRSRETLIYYEYLGLYTVPVAVLLYLFESNDLLEIPGKVAKIVIGIYPFLISVILLCHFTNIMHIQAFLSLIHIYIIVCVLTGIYIMLYDYKNKKKSQLIVIKGVFVVICVTLFELIKYNCDKFIQHKEASSISLVPVSILIFVISMSISYVQFYREYIINITEERVLLEQVYHDPLTGTYNRYKCEETLEEIKTSDIKDYIIISFDLNGLKKINDKYGHLKGDEYITEFAALVERYFGNDGVVGRMGGDEFLAILFNKDNNIAVLDKSDIANRIFDMVKEASESDIFFAYGYTISTSENPIAIMDAYKDSDMKMYQCKMQQKATR